MGLQRRHWIASLFLAIGIHLLAAAALFWQKPEDGAKSPGIGGIEIALGPAGGAPGTVAAAVPEPAAQEVPPEDVPAETPPLETAAVASETPETIPESPKPLEEAPVVETAKVDVPIEAPTPITEPVPPKPVEAKPVAAPPPPKRKPPPPKPTRKEPTPVVKPEPPQETAPAPLADPVETQQAAVTPSAPGAGGKAGAFDSPNAGDAAMDASAGGMAGAAADFMSLLQAWLEKHKEYPRRAQSRRQEGTALLYFVMNRDGDVLDFKLRKSSGYRLLDREVMAMIKRAQPLPRIPDEMGKEQMELIVPVQFFMR